MIQDWRFRVRSGAPGPVDSFIVFMTALAWATFSGLFLGPFGSWAVSAFTTGLLLIPVAMTVVRGFRVRCLFRLKIPGLRETVGGGLLACGMLVAVILCTVVVSALFPALPVSGKTFRTNVADPDLFRLILSVVILPAVCEEFLFRGFILSGIDRGSKRVSSAVLCGILFGMLHLDPVQIPFTAAVGIGLSWVALETGSIAIPVMMHAFHNLILLIIARYTLSGPVTSMASHPPFVIAAVAAGAAAVAICLIFLGIRLVKQTAAAVSPAVFP